MDEFQASSEAEAKRKAHNEKMKVYMREYRKRRKRATGAASVIEEKGPADEFGETLHTFSLPEPESSPVAPPDAA